MTTTTSAPVLTDLYGSTLKVVTLAPKTLRFVATYGESVDIDRDELRNALSAAIDYNGTLVRPAVAFGPNSGIEHIVIRPEFDRYKAQDIVSVIMTGPGCGDQKYDVLVSSFEVDVIDSLLDIID